VVAAWVSVVDAELIISNDREGTQRWLTLEEEERFAKEQALKRADEHAKRADEERAAKEAALARIAELEAMLAQRR
jgi:hypothetical protein